MAEEKTITERLDQIEQRQTELLEKIKLIGEWIDWAEGYFESIGGFTGRDGYHRQRPRVRL